MRHFFSVILVVMLFVKTSAQSYDAQRTQVFVTNIVSNALMAGIGGAINRHEGEKIYKVFAKSLLKGVAGGLVKYSAKSQVSSFHTTLNQQWMILNRLYFFAGHSMVLNAAYNRRIFHTYYCNLFGVEIKYNQAEKLKARLSVATMGCALYFASRGMELNLYRSLEWGIFYFNALPQRFPPLSDGMAAFNTVAFYDPNRTQPFAIHSAVPHELVHTFQHYEYFALSSFYDTPLRKKYKDNKTYNLFNRYIVLDYEVLFFTAAYLTQTKPAHFKNYYEFEAEHFSFKREVKR
jgi:hypothetical protein